MKKLLIILLCFPILFTSCYLQTEEQKALTEICEKINNACPMMVKENLEFTSFNCKYPKVEISSGYISKDEYLLTEFQRLRSENLPNDLHDSPASSHFFIFYTNSIDCVAAGISDPHEKHWAELWQRVINRTYGIEHRVARRHLRTCNLSQI